MMMIIHADDLAVFSLPEMKRRRARRRDDVTVVVVVMAAISPRGRIVTVRRHSGRWGPAATAAAGLRQVVSRRVRTGHARGLVLRMPTDGG